MRPTLATALIVSLQRLEAHLGSFDRTRTMAEHVQRPEYSVAPPARLCLQDDAPAAATGGRWQPLATAINHWQQPATNNKPHKPTATYCDNW